MNKIITRTIIVIFAIHALISCDREAVPIDRYILRTEVQKEISNYLSGTYTCDLRLYMFDGDNQKIQTEDGTWVREADKDTIPNYKYVIGGYDDQQVVFLDFPASKVSNAIKDNSLKEALSKLPDTSIYVDYQIRPDISNETSHKGVIQFNVHPLVLSFEMDGKEHTLELTFANTIGYEIDGDDRTTWHLPYSNFVFDLEKLSIDGKETSYFTGWDDDNAVFLFYIVNSIQ